MSTTDDVETVEDHEAFEQRSPADARGLVVQRRAPVAMQTAAEKGEP